MNNGEDISQVSSPYVAAFAATNLGDVSPNTAGAKCRDTGLACDGETSSCNVSTACLVLYYVLDIDLHI
jgi:neutral ceramidase